MGSSSIPGMGGVDRTEKQDFKLSIPGLDVQVLTGVYRGGGVDFFSNFPDIL